MPIISAVSLLRAILTDGFVHRNDIHRLVLYKHGIAVLACVSSIDHRVQVEQGAYRRHVVWEHRVVGETFPNNLDRQFMADDEIWVLYHERDLKRSIHCLHFSSPSVYRRTCCAEHLHPNCTFVLSETDVELVLNT